MAASRGKSRAQTRAEDRIAAVRNAATRPTPTRKRQDGVPEIYKDMLSEADSSAGPEATPSRPPKKRRIEQDDARYPESSTAPERKRLKAKTQPDISAATLGDSDAEDQRRPQQTIENSGDSADEDIDWEDIDFDNQASASAVPGKSADDIADISVELGPKKTQRAAVVKRKPITSVEKLLRIAVHEAHVLFLLFHLHIRNSWCNLDAIQVCRN